MQAQQLTTKLLSGPRYSRGVESRLQIFMGSAMATLVVLMLRPVERITWIFKVVAEEKDTVVQMVAVLGSFAVLDIACVDEDRNGMPVLVLSVAIEDRGVVLDFDELLVELDLAVEFETIGLRYLKKGLSLRVVLKRPERTLC